ncbi:hypothetical protein EXIGLDRAFT_767598 [Exidia glandulosa HHB12029]|uniref:Uncharacterized protein n=1 Tax=Exidia glandulosa HHB12029 TaxID=1314781 RepID=A0A165IVL7_EXIGL|nr:hypothetical protein EXIGLDRAFT_767598 [Exidia glandulosa HHB12029]
MTVSPSPNRTAHRRARSSLSFLSSNNPFSLKTNNSKTATTAAMRTPKRKVTLLRSWLACSSKTNDQNRDLQEQNVMQLEDDEDPVVVAPMEGMPTQDDLRTMSVEKMLDILRAINKRLPERCASRSRSPSKRASSARAARGRSWIFKLDPRSSPSIPIHLPVDSNIAAHQRPHELAVPSRRACFLFAHAAEVVAVRPSVRVFAELAMLRPVFVYAQRRSARAPRRHGAPRSTCWYPRRAAQWARGASAMRDPFVTPMSDDHVEMMTVTPVQTKKRTLDPVEEEVHAEEGGEPFIAKLFSGPGLMAESYSKDPTTVTQAQAVSRPIRAPCPFEGVVSDENAYAELDPRKVYSIGTQLNTAMSELFRTLDATRMWTILRIRPNASGAPNSFDKRRLWRCADIFFWTG